MKKLKRFTRLSWQQRRVLLYACLLVNGIRMGLWLMPFGKVRQSLDSIAAKWTCHHTTQPASVDFIVWAVTIAGRYTPGGAMCLVKALTTQLLFKRYQYSYKLHIGVAKSTAGHLEAHAWIEHHDSVVIGNLNNLDRYQSLSIVGASK